MARKLSKEESTEDKPKMEPKQVSKAIKRNKATEAEDVCAHIKNVLKESEENPELVDLLKKWLREAVKARNVPVAMVLKTILGSEKERLEFVSSIYETDPYGALFLIIQWKSGRRLVSKMVEYEYETEKRVIINHLAATPSEEHDNNLFRFAAKYKDTKVFDRLLREERVTNPGTHENYAIRHAAANGNVEMVKKLQSFRKKVDQTAWNHYALRHAKANGHDEVVQVLLKRAEVH